MVKCTVCRRREASFIRDYSGEKLCRRCFLKSIGNKVRVTIAKYRMFELNDRIAVAVSGGKDSLSLLHILAEVEREFQKASLCAVSVDEGIKGYRDEAIRIASENCNDLGVKHIIVSFNELYGYTMDEIVEKTRGGKLTPCSYCGVLRRRALDMAARRAEATKIAIAHNLDDEIQTFFLNIVHGGPSRIALSKPVSSPRENGLPQRVRPLCEVLEREIALYAYLKHIRFQGELCPYAGAALRNDMRRMLNRLEVEHPGMKYTIYSSMEKIRQAMEESAKEIPLKRCKICGEPSTQETCQTCQILQKLKM